MPVRTQIPQANHQPAHGAGSHPAIAAMVEQIRRVPPVERILLFGSRARGDPRERADIDLAVACPGADDADWAGRNDSAVRIEPKPAPASPAPNTFRTQRYKPR